MSLRRTIAITLLAIPLAGLVLLFLGPFFIYPTVVPTLAPVLPRPKYVPPDAAATHNWKASGMHWNWRRSLPHGDARWSATENYARVELSPERNAVSYATFDDYLVFDTGIAIEGRVPPSSGGEPCPFRVSAADIALFRQLVSEVLTQAETKGEAAVLRRIDSRLAATDGDALTSNTNGDGCADLKLEDWKRPLTRADPLENVR